MKKTDVKHEKNYKWHHIIIIFFWLNMIRYIFYYDDDDSWWEHGCCNCANLGSTRTHFIFCPTTIIYKWKNEDDIIRISRRKKNVTRIKTLNRYQSYIVNIYVDIWTQKSELIHFQLFTSIFFFRREKQTEMGQQATAKKRKKWATCLLLLLAFSVDMTYHFVSFFLLSWVSYWRRRRWLPSYIFYSFLLLVNFYGHPIIFREYPAQSAFFPEKKKKNGRKKREQNFLLPSGFSLLKPKRYPCSIDDDDHERIWEKRKKSSKKSRGAHASTFFCWNGEKKGDLFVCLLVECILRTLHE